MPLTNAEFESILGDASKRIDGNITWTEDEDHSPAREFRIEVRSDAGHPLTVKGSVNALAGTLSYTVVHAAVGRIYALDMGKDHRNPSGERVGEKHKHRWKEKLKDREAYVPADITAPVTDPVEVWKQFCKEAKINHEGVMSAPPPAQDLLL